MTMEVILLEKVQNLGDLGDVVSVKPGYGRNYLIPEGTADALETANTRRAAVEGKTVTIAVRAGEEGKMFGSVGPVDIVEALAAMDISVQKSEVRLHTGPIRQLGTYEVEVYLHPEVSANVTIAVVAEQ
jgi:large subunit ribosomal protein L9